MKISTFHTFQKKNNFRGNYSRKYGRQKSSKRTFVYCRCHLHFPLVVGGLIFPLFALQPDPCRVPRLGLQSKQPLKNQTISSLVNVRRSVNVLPQLDFAGPAEPSGGTITTVPPNFYIFLRSYFVDILCATRQIGWELVQ